MASSGHRPVRESAGRDYDNAKTYYFPTHFLRLQLAPWQSATCEGSWVRAPRGTVIIPSPRAQVWPHRCELVQVPPTPARAWEGLGSRARARARARGTPGVATWNAEHALARRSRDSLRRYTQPPGGDV
jgi:hypothetical protein